MLDSIKTIVLLQFENRSFDHMLGHLSYDNTNPQVNGLKQDLSQYQNFYKGDAYTPFMFTVDTNLTDDLPHEYTDVATQLAWSGLRKQFQMTGFVEAYANKTGRSPNPQADPMGFFGAEHVPITHFLAGAFCVCDQWHCPLPSSTQPNKTMALCGESSIYYTKTQLISATNNLFDWMDKAGVRWRVYHDGLSFFILYNSLWGHVLGPHFRDYENLYKDFQQEHDDTFPQVIVVEPSYQSGPHLGPDHPNCNHAPLAIGWGEDFLRRTYEAVTSNAARWGNTLMLVYSDEHGGFFDHVAPPAIAYTTEGADPHTFSSLGPRIPGLIISSFVKEGSICHQLLDHTSVLQLLAEKFTPGTPYSPTVEDRRKKGIGSISAALDMTLPTRAAPAPPQQPISVSSALGDTIATPADTDPMRQSFETAAMNMLAAQPAPVGDKYPELLQWRDVVAKARAKGGDGAGS
ncbi:MAG TPA: alkaline phosphatase family protein [Puia sp.]|nr:alkaline phosphatase family protein [Puia sp.]